MRCRASIAIPDHSSLAAFHFKSHARSAVTSAKRGAALADSDLGHGPTSQFGGDRVLREAIITPDSPAHRPLVLVVPQPGLACPHPHKVNARCSPYCDSFTSPRCRRARGPQARGPVLIPGAVTGPST